MSYTSSDQENVNCDFDTSSLASASTASSQPSKGKKKPWSKFKSSIKSIGDKMSSKPKFPEQAEGGEQKRSKKNKKPKGSGSSDEVKSYSSEEKKEKSPPGPKNLIKTSRVETAEAAVVDYQPKSVSPTMTYAKAVHKSGSTSESNLSTSDMDSPRRVLTLDKNTKYSLVAQESPDSGRVSQEVEGREASSDFSVDSDYALGPKRTVLGNLEAVGSEKIQDKDTDVSAEFIKAETEVNPPHPVPKTTPSAEPPKISEQEDKSKYKTQEGGEDKKDKLPKTEAKDDVLKPSPGEVEGRRKKKDVYVATNENENTSADFIKSEQAKSKEGNIVQPTEDEKSSPGAKLEITEGSNKTDPNSRKSKDSVTKSDSKEDNSKAIQSSKPEESKENTSSGSKEKNKEDKPISKPREDEENSNNTQETNVSQENESKTPDTKEIRANLPTKDELPTPTEVSQISDKTKTPSKATEDAPQDVKMTVDEKLEAFLSSEGWCGTIKDIVVRAGADGSQQPDKRECLYKILVIGELGTGKTSIIKRYVHQFFSQHYRATIGVDFALKVLNWDTNTIIRLQLWDIAGQERFGNMTRVYYKEAVGAFIVFDVTRSATFDAVLKWKQDLDSKVQLADGSPIPCVLLANKCDQQKEGIVNTPAKMEEYCKENNFSTWFETSAKENINIDEAAKSLVTQILQNDKMSQNGRDSARDGGKFPLDGKSEQEGKSCAC